MRKIDNAQKENWMAEHKTEIKWFVFLLLILPIFELLNRPIGQIHSLHIPLDDKIPFWIGFLPIYHSWVVFLLFFTARMIWTDRKEFGVLIRTLVFGYFCAYLTFIFFQTYIPRPELTQAGFLYDWMRATHKLDNHFAGFPSCHVLTIWALLLSVAASKDKKWVKIFVWVWGILVMASTVLVKQHVFLDIPGGILYASLLFLFFSTRRKREEATLDEHLGKE